MQLCDIGQGRAFQVYLLGRITVKAFVGGLTNAS